MLSQIKNLDDLLNLNDKIKSCSAKDLTEPGENYGSQMLALELELKGSAEKLNLVAKLVPPSDFMKKTFNTQVTFTKEVCFYSELIPTLQEFQKERGCEEVINFIPKYYCSRFNLKPEQSNEVDDDACLLLENIKIKGFGLADRLEGFDLDTARFLLRDLATLHAVAIGFKLTHPECFRKVVKPFLEQNFNEDSMPREASTRFFGDIIKYAAKNDKCLPHLKKLEIRLNEQMEYFKSKTDELEESIFATIIHNDFWVNNMMILKNENGKISKSRMLDFQVVGYGNPAHDILFFIYSSLSEEIIKNHYDNLIEVYHETFLETLGDLKIDTTAFTLEKLGKEIYNSATKLQLSHILFMLKPILNEKDKALELKDQTEKSLLDLDGVSDLFKSKVCFTILDFVEKGWL